MTLKEVAKRANVSVSTASKALKGSYDVAEETRRHVLLAAQEVGYFHKKKQITLVNHHPDGWYLAILSPEVASPFYNDITQRVTAAAKAAGCQVMIFETGFHAEEINAVARDCVNNPHINAIISFSRVKEELATDTVPIITLSPSRRFTHIDTSISDALSTVREMYPDDISVAIVGESLTTGRQQEIARYFPHAVTIAGRNRYDIAGQQAADRLLAMPTLPQLVFCTYDEIAYGLIDRLKTQGIRIPEDVEVIGINDSYSSQWVHGGLSSIAFDYGTLFDEVIRDTIFDLQHLGFHVRHYRVNTRFVRRNSTK